MKQQKCDIGWSLLHGLDEEKDKKWLDGMMIYNDDVVRGGQVSYPCFPLVKNKRLRVEVSVMSKEIHLVFERRLENITRGVRLNLDEYDMLRDKFPLIQDLINANQTTDKQAAIEEVLRHRGNIVNELYGWKFCRIPLLGDLKLTFKWHEQREITLMKINRGHPASPKEWVPDVDQEICLGAGGMEYLMRYLNNNVLNAIEMWKRMLREAKPDLCMYSFLDEKTEVDQAVSALLNDPESGSGWVDS